MKIFKVIKKEFKEFVRDRGFILTMILEPFILMLISGYTFQADITNLNTIVINNDQSQHSQEIIQAIEQSEYFNHISFSGTLDQAKEQLRTSKVRAVFYIPSDFGTKLENATRAELYLYLDSSDYTIYNILKGAAGEVIKESLKDIVSLLVGDLEEERDAKQKRVDDIESLVDSLDQKTKNTSNQVNGIVSQIDSIRTLLQDTESKVTSTQIEIAKIDSEINSLKSDIQSTINSLNELESTLSQLKESNPLLTPSIDPLIVKLADMEVDVKESMNRVEDLKPSSRTTISKEYYNIGGLSQQIDSNKEKANSISKTTHEMENTYKDIQDKVADIDLELRTLKKEFLSFPLDIDRQYMFGEISYFKYLTPALITLVLFFIGVVLTTINIVDERTNKTLFRIATTPLKKYELFCGKFFIFFLAGVVESIYVILMAIFIFDVKIVGSLINVMIVLLLLIAASLGLGLLISAVVKTMRQAVMLIPLVVIPSILISQTFAPIEVMPEFMQYVAYLSPMFYSNVALREIMIKGTALNGTIIPVIILGVYALITLSLGILISKKSME